MFILFGTRGMNKEMGATKISYHCNNCNNDNFFKVTRLRRYFTLFFIPIFPVSSKYFVHCPICDRGAEVKKKDIGNFIDL